MLVKVGAAAVFSRQFVVEAAAQVADGRLGGDEEDGHLERAALDDDEADDVALLLGQRLVGLVLGVLLLQRGKELGVGEQSSGITLTVGGYLCKTAVCQLHGRKWTVRYAEDIATTAGPWKLCGLPGLIVEAVSDDGTHRFTLTELQHATAPVFYETNAITVKTSEEKLIKNRNKTFGNRLYPKDSHYYIANLQSVDVVFVDEGSIINGTYVDNKAHVYMPLEKE